MTTNRQVKVEFQTAKFEFAHGRKPKGWGGWWFEFEGQEFRFSGTFTEARKACVAAVRAAAPEGFSATVFVEVCS